MLMNTEIFRTVFTLPRVGQHANQGISKELRSRVTNYDVLSVNEAGGDHAIRINLQDYGTGGLVVGRARSLDIPYCAP